MDNYEIWKDCKGYEGKYQVSNQGRIWSVKSQKYLKPWLNSSGYWAVQLMAPNGKRKGELVHRLVALAFIDNPNNLPQVNHKDENKQNCNVDNLEWCDTKYNLNYGTRNLRASQSNSIQVYCVELDRVFNSITEAQEILHINKQNIVAVCKGRRKTCGGYHWKYWEES